jgi:lipopolysaccharide biosynthesis regulator YciM
MAEMVLYSQRVYAKRINEIYLVALNQLERDIQDAISFAEQSISKQKNEANVKILKQNIESNKFSNEVVDMYREILLAQEKNLKKAMKDSKNNVDVAYSTFDTVTISSNLVNLIDTTQDEFNKVMNMQIPQIVPFENKILEERFVDISNKISVD